MPFEYDLLLSQILNLQFLELYEHDWKIHYSKSVLASLCKPHDPWFSLSSLESYPDSEAALWAHWRKQRKEAGRGVTRNPFNNVTSKATKMWLLSSLHLGVCCAFHKPALSGRSRRVPPQRRSVTPDWLWTSYLVPSLNCWTPNTEQPLGRAGL